MPTIESILEAEATLAAARTPVADLSAGDRVVVHRAPPGDIVCSITAVGTVVSTLNSTPSRIHPAPWWAVVVLLDTGEKYSFECSGGFSVLRATTESILTGKVA